MTVRHPGGTTVAVQAITDSAGFAITRYLVSRRSETGTYEVQLTGVTGQGVTLDLPASVDQATFTVN